MVDNPSNQLVTVGQIISVTITHADEYDLWGILNNYDTLCQQKYA